MRAVAIHQSSLNLIIFHSYDPIDIQEGGADFIGYKIVILSNPNVQYTVTYNFFPFQIFSFCQDFQSLPKSLFPSKNV